MLAIRALAGSLILAASPALAETSFIFDSQGGTGTIITPGDGSTSFFFGSDGTTGTILRSGGENIGFYNFSQPGGRQHSGTILTFPSPPTQAPPPATVAPAPPLILAPPSPLRGSPSVPSRWPDWQR
ncbi:hypothetical protein [Nitrospira sp. Kam-Ns4a]